MAIFRTGFKVWLVVYLLSFVANADPLDDEQPFHEKIDGALSDIYGRRWHAPIWTDVDAERSRFADGLKSPEARAVILESFSGPVDSKMVAARRLGRLKAQLEDAKALEMLYWLGQGNRAAAREWRMTLSIPKYANAKRGLFALMDGNAQTTDAISVVLAQEYVDWQITRAREKFTALKSLIVRGNADPAMVAARTAEIQALGELADEFVRLDAKAFVKDPMAWSRFQETYGAMQRNIIAPPVRVLELFDQWRGAFEATAPNLLDAPETARQEALLVNLLPFMTHEYRAAVRDGAIRIPIEYQEAETTHNQVQQTLLMLLPVWKVTKPEWGRQYCGEVQTLAQQMQTVFEKKQDAKVLDAAVATLTQALIQGEIGRPPGNQK